MPSRSSSSSLLDCLPRELFIYLCTFLSIDDKRFKLAVLNKDMKVTLRPECYSTDTLYFTFPDVAHSFDSAYWRRYSLNKLKGRLGYLEHVKSVSFKCESEDAARSELAIRLRDAILDGVASGKIRSLFLDDYNDTICGALLTTISLPNSLTQLVFGSGGSFAGLSNLQYCTNLLDVHVKWAEADWQNEHDLAGFRSFMNSLPEQLKRLRLTMDADLTYMVEPDLERAFESQTLLPHLEEFMLYEITGDISNTRCAQPLCDTIMKQTKQIRPIKCACFFLEHDCIRSLVPFPLLTDCSLQTDELSVDCSRHLMSCLPSLTKFDLLLLQLTNSTSLLEHLPHTSLLQLSLRQSDPEEEGQETDYEKWTNESLKALAKLRNLQSFELELVTGFGSQLFEPDVTFDLLPMNSWPHLVKLYLKDAWLSVNQLSGLLVAAPALQEITFVSIVPNHDQCADLDEDQILNYPLIIALVGHYCKHLVSFSLINRVNSNIGVQHVNAAFGRFPFSINSFSQLRSLTLDDWGSKLIHSLFSHLSHQARQLECVVLQTITLLDLCMLRVFPNLRYLDLNEDFISQYHYLPLSDLFSSHIQPLSAVYEDKDPVYQAFQPVEKGEIYHTFRINQSINQSINQPIRNGRDMFFSLIYNLLSSSEQTRLTLWDRGIYETQECSQKCKSGSLCYLCQQQQDESVQFIPDELFYL